MNTTHDDDATTWRDLADALTPQQIAYIEDWELHPDEPPMADGSRRPAEDRAAGLLLSAREFVQQNAAAALFADVPTPPDDGVHYPWEHYGDGVWQRFFYGTTRQVGDAEVVVSGLQLSDGSITRSIPVQSAESLDVETARLLAVALVNAADELERLS